MKWREVYIRAVTQCRNFCFSLAFLQLLAMLPVYIMQHNQMAELGKESALQEQEALVGAGIWHNTWDERYRQPFFPVKEGEPLTLRVRTRRGEVQKGELLLYGSHFELGAKDAYWVDFGGEEGEALPLEKEDGDESYDYWRVTLCREKCGIYGYKFRFDDRVEYGEDESPGGSGLAGESYQQLFRFVVYKGDFHTPDWAKEGVAYQIFPDRFANGNPVNDHAREYAEGWVPLYNLPWNKLPGNWGETNSDEVQVWDYNDVFGGDFEGIRQKLDYLQELGVTVVYLNPVFYSGSIHRYDTVDYSRFDPVLGTEAEFRQLSEELQSRGMHLILDGVFNHVGADSLYFDRYGKYQEVGAYEFWARVYGLMEEEKLAEEEAKSKARQQLLEEGQSFSPYGFEDWFDLYREKSRDFKGEHYRYRGWQTSNDIVAFRDEAFPLSAHGEGASSLGEFLLYGEDAVMMCWQKYGFDGWRLDVSDEIPPGFWQLARQKIKKAQEDYFLLGEYWGEGSRLLLGNQLDAITNYGLYAYLTEAYLLAGRAELLQGELNLLWQKYPREAMEASMNILGSHDTRRAIFKLGGGSKEEKRASEANFDYELGKARYKLGLAFIMGYPGMPTILYGDEAGLTGAGDPDNRRPFPWGSEDVELQDYCRRLIAVRNSHRELFGHGDVWTLAAEGDIFAYERSLGEEGAVAVFNRGRGRRVTLKSGRLPEGTVLRDALSDRVLVVKEDGFISLYVPENRALLLLRSQEGYEAPFFNREEFPVSGVLADWLFR